MKKIGTILFLMCFVVFASAQSKGYEKSIEFGGGIGLDKLSKYSIGISMVNGYRFNNYLYVGVGTGFKYTDALYYSSSSLRDYYESFDGKYLIPLYARIKANLTKTKVSPFLVVDAGYTFDVGQNENKNIEGLMIEPAFGIDFKLNEEKISLYFLLGVNIQKTRFTHFRKISDEENNEFASALSLKLGIKF